MKNLSIAIAVAAAALAWSWWLRRRGQQGKPAESPSREAAAAQPGIDDAMVRTPPNPDPAMVRVPPNPDPNMLTGSRGPLRQPGASGNGRKA